MPTQTVNSVSRTQCAAVMIYFSSVKVKWSSLLQDDLGFSFASPFCPLASVLAKLTRYFFVYIYIFNWKRKSALRPPLVKHVTSLNNCHASNCIIQSHNQPLRVLAFVRSSFVCGFYIFSHRTFHFHTSKWAEARTHGRHTCAHEVTDWPFVWSMMKFGIKELS